MLRRFEEKFCMNATADSTEDVMERGRVHIRGRKRKQEKILSGLVRDRRCHLGDPGHWSSAEQGFLASLLGLASSLFQGILSVFLAFTALR